MQYLKESILTGMLFISVDSSSQAGIVSTLYLRMKHENILQNLTHSSILSLQVTQLAHQVPNPITLLQTCFYLNDQLFSSSWAQFQIASIQPQNPVIYHYNSFIDTIILPCHRQFSHSSKIGIFCPQFYVENALYWLHLQMIQDFLRRIPLIAYASQRTVLENHLQMRQIQNSLDL